ncbi:MAG: hypothetical protein M3022_17215 [Actinomycetota bacterium]|nr:hypothetical protein [Actinomycetota bacterium]
MARCRVLLALLATALATTAATAATAAVVPVNAIRITDPAPVLTGSVYDLTISGVAHRRSTAYLFVDYAGCAPTQTAELRRSPHAYDSYPVAGSFDQVTGWKSSSPGTDHACAYLVARGGGLLATARIPFVIR